MDHIGLAHGLQDRAPASPQLIAHLSIDRAFVDPKSAGIRAANRASHIQISDFPALGSVLTGGYRSGPYVGSPLFERNKLPGISSIGCDRDREGDLKL
jgi:hypothetical protein